MPARGSRQRRPTQRHYRALAEAGGEDAVVREAFFQFFDATSFKIALSSIAPANRFSRPFSCSSTFSLGACETYMPRRLPLVEGRTAHPMLAAYICRRRSRLLLAQDRNDLLLLKCVALQRRRPSRRTLAQTGGVSGEHLGVRLTAPGRPLRKAFGTLQFVRLL